MRVLVNKASRDIHTHLQLFEFCPADKLPEIPAEQFRSYLAVHMAIAWAIYLANILPEQAELIYSDSYLFLNVEQNSILNQLVECVFEHNLLSDYHAGYLTGLLSACRMKSVKSAESRLWSEFTTAFSDLLHSMAKYQDIGITIVRRFATNLDQCERTVLTNAQKQWLVRIAKDCARQSAEVLQSLLSLNTPKSTSDMMVHEYMAKSKIVPLLLSCTEEAVKIANPERMVSLSHRNTPPELSSYEAHVARLTDQCSSEIWRLLMTCQIHAAREEMEAGLTDIILQYLMFTTCETVSGQETIGSEEGM